MRRTRMKIKKRVVPDHMVYKLFFVFMVLTVMLVMLVGAVYKVLKENGDRYEKRALAQQTYVSSEIPYRRGEIQDRNGTVFARSETVYDMFISPKDILLEEEDKDTGKKVQRYLEPALSALETYFGYTREEIMEKIQEKPGSQYLNLQIDMDAQLVEDYKESRKKEQEAVKERNKQKKKGEEKETFVNLDNCIYFEMKYKRIYPLESTASNTIGFATGNTRTGVENYYNEELTGTAGRNYGYFNSEGELERIVKPAEDGNTVVTTLDANVQQIVEKHIKRFQEGEIGAERVAVVLSNPQNGEIYAMASTNSYDLNKPFTLEGYTRKQKRKLLESYYTEEQIKKMEEEAKKDKTKKEEWNAAVLHTIWRNFCVSDAYEPGSTFKPYTVAAVLDEHSATNKTSYYCDGYQMVSGWSKPIKCTHVHGQISMAQTIMFSCNDALMQMAAKLGAGKFYQYERLFGLGQTTGVDLPNEATGRLISELTPVDLAACSFGQSNNVTMMQMIAGFSSIINGGNYYVPHVMKKIVDNHGAVVENYPDEVVRKTVSESTRSLLKKYLLRTVSDDASTATGARVKGYEVGGKTGTAEKFPRGEGNYLLSFLGYVGYEKPQVVIYVIIDEPHVEDQAHSGIATNFASEVLNDVLPFLGIYKEDSSTKKTLEAQTASGAAGNDAAGASDQTEGEDKEGTQAGEDAGESSTEGGQTEEDTGESTDLDDMTVPDNNDGGEFSFFGSDDGEAGKTSQGGEDGAAAAPEETGSGDGGQTDGGEAE